MGDQELEVKYYVNDLAAVERRVQELGAQLTQGRTHEINLRFDTPDNELGRGMRVLRLRRDTAARLTYKGPATSQEGVRVRQEIEFIVDDFNAARAFLEALGYQVSMIYEKYRTVYDLEGVHVTLDEMPYGDFVELEGPDPESIQAANAQLGLDWERRAPESYTVIFERMRGELNLPFRHLVFESFDGLEIGPAELKLQPADRPENQQG